MISPSSGELRLVVDAIKELSPQVRAVVLRAADGVVLPSFAPGSNLPVQWGVNRFNSYSLTGDGYEPRVYEISVRRDDEGAGGSAWVHSLVSQSEVVAMRPRSEFAPVLVARKLLLIAGGIGVTPILSHARAARRMVRPFEVHYVTRDGVHRDELQELAPEGLQTYASRQEFHDALPHVLRRQPMGAHLYMCGPAGLLDDVSRAADDACWPPIRVHSEMFGGSKLDAGEPFSIECVESGVEVDVPSGVSALEAMEAAGLRPPNLCRRGFCGVCRTKVLEGVVLHRDHYLSADDVADGHSMMVCVSRGRGNLRLQQ